MDERLFASRTRADVVAGVGGIGGDYRAACRAERLVAEETLEATRMCRRFLEDTALWGVGSRDRESSVA